MKLMNINRTIDYPKKGIFISLAIACIMPFISQYLIFMPFLIQVYRLIKYDSWVFVADIALLVSFSTLFVTPSGDSLIAFLIALAAIVFIFVKGNFSFPQMFLIVFAFACYLLLRSETRFSDYIFIITGLFFAFAYSSAITDFDKAATVVTLFIAGCLGSSIYALIFRNFSVFNRYTAQTLSTGGEEATARFSGLFQDCNYYCVFLLIAWALLFQLYYIKKLGFLQFGALSVPLILFGILTYSKTFVVVTIIAILFYILLSLKSKRYILAISLTIGIILLFVFLESIDILSVVVSRFSEAEDINSLTTGRFDSWLNYIHVIFNDLKIFLIGGGFKAPLLEIGTHNLYIEVWYYIGIIGLIPFFAILIYPILVKRKQFRKDFTAYIVIIVLFILYFSLQAMYNSMFYVQVVIATVGAYMVFYTQEEKEI